MVTLTTNLITYILCIPAGLLANFVLDKYGLRKGVLCGCVFLLIGVWINVLNEHGFYFLFAGYFISAIGQPFILNAPQVVSYKWFLPHERAMSTAVGAISSPVGSEVGFLISSAFVSNNVTGLTGLKQFHNLMLFCAILTTIAIAFNILLLKNKPPTPLSQASSIPKLNTVQSLKSLSKNWSYIIFVVSASLAFGSFNTLGGLFEPIIYPFGFSRSQVSKLGAITLFSGLVGSIIWAVYVGKTQKFKCSIIICSIVTTGFSVFTETGLYLEKFFVTAIAMAFLGFFALSMLSLGFELCAELSFPVAEGTTGGIFLIIVNVASVAGILISDTIVKGETKLHSMYVIILIVGVQVIALIGFCVFKENLRRSHAEKEKVSEIRVPSQEIKSEGEVTRS